MSIYQRAIARVHSRGPVSVLSVCVALIKSSGQRTARGDKESKRSREREQTKIDALMKTNDAASSLFHYSCERGIRARTDGRSNTTTTTSNTIYTERMLLLRRAAFIRSGILFTANVMF